MPLNQMVQATVSLWTLDNGGNGLENGGMTIVATRGLQFVNFEFKRAFRIDFNLQLQSYIT